MIFSNKPGELFPFPTAFTKNIGLQAAFPQSGSPDTGNPLNFRSVIRTRASKSKTKTSPYPYNPEIVAADTLWRIAQQRLAWLTYWWFKGLTSSQRAAWVTLQNTADASADPPGIWRPGSPRAKGFQLFLLCNHSAIPHMTNLYDYIPNTTQPALVDAPDSWAPPANPGLSATWEQNPPSQSLSLNSSTGITAAVTVYTSRLGSTANAFNQPPLLMCAGETLLPAQFLLDPADLAVIQNPAVAHVRSGTTLTVACRIAHSGPLQPPSNSTPKTWEPSDLATFTFRIDA